MYEEIRATLSILSMSNNSETMMFLAKNDDQLEESSKFNILKRPSLEEFQDQSHVQAEFHIMNVAAAASPDPINEVVQIQEEEEEEGKCFVDEIRKSSLGEIKVTKDDDDDDNDDNDDGFRTPTSLDHKIPVMTQCPPAPRKPKLPPLSIISSPSRKRKLPLRRVLDFSKEVESLFLLRDDISRIIKKARNDDVTDN